MKEELREQEKVELHIGIGFSHDFNRLSAVFGSCGIQCDWGIYGDEKHTFCGPETPVEPFDAAIVFGGYSRILHFKWDAGDEVVKYDKSIALV